jgi:D-xylose transport system ATP-binding protein
VSLAFRRASELNLLRLSEIGKSFSGVSVLRGLSFSLRPGECLGVVGENGAGKSTLMKILCGVWPHGTYEGEFTLNDQVCRFLNPRDALDAGIFIIHQELSVFENLSIMENLFMGRFPNRCSSIEWEVVRQKTQEQLTRLGLHQLRADQSMATLRTGEKQMIEIARALLSDTKIVIFDEPTSALTEREIGKLYEMIDLLKSKNIACLLISHKLDEIRRLCERCVVLRDGNLVSTNNLKETTDKQLVSLMVGREIADIFPPKPKARKRPSILEVINLAYKPGPSGRPLLKNLSFTLGEGEILGIAGLMGAGRTELVMAIFGALQAQKISGEIYVRDQLQNIRGPQDAMALGMGLVSEDRKLTGAFLHLNVRENLVLPNLNMISKHLWIDEKAENQMLQKQIQRLHIRTQGGEQNIATLSGGNQQKVLLGRWLARETKILILDEPTRGIDVGAKSEIYRLLRELADRGVSILMVSSELPEVIGMSDRVLVMKDGVFTGELSQESMTPESVMRYATGLA